MKRGKERKQEAVKAKKQRLLSPLTRRILTVNIVALIIPVAGLLYLGPYRDQLVEREMQTLRIQGEIFAGALGEGAINILDDGRAELNLTPARHIVRRLSRSGRARARLFLTDGAMVADSRALDGFGHMVRVEVLPELNSGDEPLDPLLDFVDRMARLMEDEEPPFYQDHNETRLEDFPEVGEALKGEGSRMVRRDKNGQLILSMALPVQHYYQVTGALLLSKEGVAIEAAMREVRQTILAVFAGALIITTLLSLYLAGTIARPVHRLAGAAERVRHSIGRNEEQIPDFTDRHDEIGDLSGALRDMTTALRARLVAIERFAADVAHEIKNPLTSLRSAVETARKVEDENKRRELMQIIYEDVGRLDRLITDISNASRLDAELSRTDASPVVMNQLLETLTAMHNSTAAENEASRVELDCFGKGPFVVSGMEDRLVQVFRNLIGNAVSFSPKGGRIAIRLSQEEDWLRVVVEDDGPGIPESKLEAVFDRFYSERPKAEKFGTHSGLGLAISKQIVKAHGGSIRAENRKDAKGNVKGARFVLRFPAVKEGE